MDRRRIAQRDVLRDVVGVEDGPRPAQHGAPRRQAQDVQPARLDRHPDHVEARVAGLRIARGMNGLVDGPLDSR